MVGFRARRGRRAACLALLVSVGMPAVPGFAQEMNVLQAPAGMEPVHAPALPAGSGQADGPRSIVPPGYGATTPASGLSSPDMQAVSPAVPSQLFPTGRQSSEPAVRVLSAVPGGERSDIEIGTLSGVDTSSVGLVGLRDGGFGPTMWQGASRADIETYLVRMPVATGSPVMNDLAQRLLLTGARPPEGAGRGVPLLAARLNRLLAAGRADEALQLAMAGGAARAPQVAVELARAALAAGDDNRACAALADIPPGNDPERNDMAAFAVKLSAYCQIVAGNPEIANLTLDLAREEGLNDALFFSLAGQAAAGITLRAPEPNTLSIIDAAFYRLAGRDLPDNVAEIAEPALLPGLLRDGELKDEVRLAVAERAARYDLIDGRELATYYKMPRFTDEQMAGLLTSDIPEASPMRRAMIHQAIGAAVAADDRIRLFKLAFATGETAGLYYPTVEALYDELAGMTPSDALRPMAPAATRAFLAIGERSKAAEWLSVMNAAPGLGRDGRELAALMRISGGALAAFDSEGVSAEIIADLRSGERRAQIFAACEAMLLDALGLSPTPAVWEALLDARNALPGDAPSEALLGQLQMAGHKKAIGETVLLTLDVLGLGGPGAAHPRAAAQATASLKAVDLESEARRLALEALLARSFAGRG
ncbi:hypothetical protein [Parvibaculum sp.]|uniref:hypothetical protein n=1 Tax=Parvibaculum sp. TaxID=2024848 RepID=UPI001D7929F7|nr:hypothetical protein [Parvibaculum sp.]MBX3489318.1 hypothetical protein [Parvibaculum sp.]